MIRVIYFPRLLKVVHVPRAIYKLSPLLDAAICEVRNRGVEPYNLLETLTCHRLHDDKAKIRIIDLVHIPLHTCHCVSY
jgi:hypothetical protein